MECGIYEAVKGHNLAMTKVFAPEQEKSSILKALLDNLHPES